MGSEESAGNAETILTNTSDEGVQKQRDGLVQEFFAEKLQGRINSNYERNAGNTGKVWALPQTLLAISSVAHITVQTRLLKLVSPETIFALT